MTVLAVALGLVAVALADLVGQQAPSLHTDG